MNELQKVVGVVLKQQKSVITASAYDTRKNYLNHLMEHGDAIGISEPCQKLYDFYQISNAGAPDLRFQLYHAVRLVGKAARTMAFSPEGKLYNEPEIPPPEKQSPHSGNFIPYCGWTGGYRLAYPQSRK